jgi:hypothetical protein
MVASCGSEDPDPPGGAGGASGKGGSGTAKGGSGGGNVTGTGGTQGGTGGTPTTGTGGTLGGTGGSGGGSAGSGGAPSGSGGGGANPDAGGGQGGNTAPAPDLTFGTPCTDAPSATIPALKKSAPITGFAGQAGQVTGVPGENTLYVVGHRNGNLYTVIDGKVAGMILHVDISAGAGNEQGLLSMALHPKFKENKLFYIFYTAPNQNFVIDEYERMTPMMATKKATLYNAPRTGGTPYHNGGSLAFSPKDEPGKFLYLSMGNHNNRGQSSNPTGVAGRILKFDLVAKGAPTTVAFGMRNPYRMSIDRLTGDFWVGEVADPQGGSVLFVGANEANANKNFGYSASAAISNGISGMQAGSAALIGGITYRGNKIKGLCGRHFFGMHNGGGVRSLIQMGGTRMGNITNHPELVVPGNISSFGEDGEGEIWMSSMNGNSIYKIEAATP